MQGKHSGAGRVPLGEPRPAGGRLAYMNRLQLSGLAALMFAFPPAALACDGPAGRSVAVTYDGRKFTVTDMGRQTVNVTFTAYNISYNLQLAPGQSDTPRSPGMLGQPMQGYQSCSATIVPAR